MSEEVKNEAVPAAPEAAPKLPEDIRRQFYGIESDEH